MLPKGRIIISKNTPNHHHSNTTMEDNLKKRCPQWKMTSMEDNLKGRQSNERQPQRKTISMEEDEFVLITFKFIAKQQLMVVDLLRATLLQ